MNFCLSYVENIKKRKHILTLKIYIQEYEAKIPQFSKNVSKQIEKCQIEQFWCNTLPALPDTRSIKSRLSHSTVHKKKYFS